MNNKMDYKGRMNEMMARSGVQRDVYHNKQFERQPFPFDTIPRIIPKEEFDYLEKGLAQRADALNLFLQDIYGEQAIVRGGIIPEDFVLSSQGYLPQCRGIQPPEGVFGHIAGMELVKSKDGCWYVLSDNLRMPSGASYPMIARELTKQDGGAELKERAVADNSGFSIFLKKTMEEVSRGGICAVLTSGRYATGSFESGYLAEKTGATAVTCHELFVEGNVLYYRPRGCASRRVGALYRRIPDAYLDPHTFLQESLIGVPHLMDAYRAGNVAILSAPGCGVADERGMYYFVPDMIRFYLGQEPILPNVPAYLPQRAAQRRYVLQHLPRLIVKDVMEAGGYGVIYGRGLDADQLAGMRRMIEKYPRRFLAQEEIDIQDVEVVEGDTVSRRKASLRAFVLTGRQTRVPACGLTRFAKDSAAFVGGSSTAEGFKDTWILC